MVVDVVVTDRVVMSAVPLARGTDAVVGAAVVAAAVYYSLKSVVRFCGVAGEYRRLVGVTGVPV